MKHLPGGEGVVKDRILKPAVEKKKRKSGPSGASNWPQGPRVARERFKAESARRAAERAAAAALREAIDELEEEDGDGPYPVRSPAEWMAITGCLSDNCGRCTCIEASHGINENEDDRRKTVVVVLLLLPTALAARGRLFPAWATTL